MKRNNFFAKAASKALALAATVMMSLAFAACGSDSNDDGGSGGTPEPLPTPKTQTVTLDGVEKSILKAEYEDNGDGDYYLYLYLSDNHKEKVIMQLNKELHMTGNSVNLTKKEKKHTGKWYWAVGYHKPDGTTLIYTHGRPGNDFPVFTTGTLTVSGSPKGTINIKLENGRVIGNGGKEHTLTVSYSGKMDKSSGTPTPKTQTVTLDGVEKPILKAEYEDKGYNNNYLLYLYLSVDYKEDVQFVLNKDQHMTGNPIDLTKKEKEHAGYYWSIEYHKSNGSSLINIFGRPDNSFPVFITGTLTATGNPKSGKVSIKLENGRVEGKDGKEHTLTVSYIGPITKE